jgi:uncharacterized membrane protein
MIMPRHLKEEFAKIQSFQDKAADRITAFSGSMSFIYIHALFFGIWIVFNLMRDKQGFDPYPFNLLTLAVSLEAIFLSTFVMLSQNRQSKQSDLRSELDYEINVKAEKEILEIKQLLESLRKGQEEIKSLNDQAIG